MAEKPKIDEVINNLSKMSKIFYQIIILSDCLDRLIESETSIEKVKLNVKIFVTNLERMVKDYTNYEMILTTFFKTDIVILSINIKDDLEKDVFEKGESSNTISLCPQTSKTKPIFDNQVMSQEREIMRLHGETMERLFGLTNTKHKIIDKYGIFPRIYFLQGSNPEEIIEWYDFGSIATIYLTTPDFPEIERLPGWIKDSVRDNFGNNSIIKIDDTLALDFFSASPDFDENQTYPVWHLIQMRKIVNERNMILDTKKIFCSFTEDNVHYRRGLGLIIVKR